MGCITTLLRHSNVQNVMNPSNSCTYEAAITAPSDPWREVTVQQEQLWYENNMLQVKCGINHYTHASMKIRKIRVMLSGKKVAWNPNAAGWLKIDELT